MATIVQQSIKPVRFSSPCTTYPIIDINVVIKTNGANMNDGMIQQHPTIRPLNT